MLCICTGWFVTLQCVVQATYSGMSLKVARSAVLLTTLAVMQPVGVEAMGIWLSNFDSKVVSSAIDSSMRSIGIGAIILALIA